MSDLVDNVNEGRSHLALAISEEIHGLRHLFNARRYRSIPGAGHDLSHMEGRVIHYLADHPGARQGDLVTHLARDKGQVARLVLTLRKDGIVESQPDPQDRRQQRLVLTPLGHDVLTHVKAGRQLVARLAIEDFSDDETELLLSMLRRVRKALDESA